MSKRAIIPIIILNWNGADDTIECIESLFQIKNVDFCIIVADNCSSDGSVTKIQEWLNREKIMCAFLREGDVIDQMESGKVYFILLNQNYGFAKGNNLVISSIAESLFEYALLLNNDTVVHPDFLSMLYNFSQQKKEYKVLTPLICYYDDRKKIWNAGGKIFLGLRKYYYQNNYLHEVKKKKKQIDISFVSGCALFFHKDLLNKRKIFTEKFFFGEEDFEFSMRMKKYKIKMACVINSIIYHKVSSSTTEFGNLNKIYLYYLNRFVNIKLNTSTFYFMLWKHGYLLYIFYLLKKKGFSMQEVLSFIRKLYTESAILNEVNQKTFNDIIYNTKR